MMRFPCARRCAPLALLLVSKVALAAPPSSASVAKSAHGADAPRLFLAGPAIFLIVLSCVAAAALIVSAFGGLEKLTDSISAGARRLESGKALSVLWGLCVGVILIALAVVLFASKVLAVLGVIVLLIALAVFGAGLATAAITNGRAILAASGSLEIDDLACLRLGLWVLFFASSLPFLGWLVVLIATAGGLGAFGQQLLTRRE